METQTKTTAQEEIVITTQPLKKEWIKLEMMALEVNMNTGILTDMGEPGTGRS